MLDDKITLDSTAAQFDSKKILEFLQEQMGEDSRLCYQCGKCSAGCPVSYAMDMTPRQVMRAIQFGLMDEILNSSAIWLCVSCQVCSARCPREIDIAKVMEGLRNLALAEKRKAKEKEIALFNNIFLGLVLRLGKIYELGLGMLFNLRTGRPFSNIGVIPAMLSRGKLAIFPPKIKGMKQVRQIVNRVKDLEKEMS
ncbi:4Fe-4S dicluster domain-containing protein [Chloroflexota bacterium]